MGRLEINVFYSLSLLLLLWCLASFWRLLQKAGQAVVLMRELSNTAVNVVEIILL